MAKLLLRNAAAIMMMNKALLILRGFLAVSYGILLSDDIQSGGVMAAYPVRASSLQAISKDPLSLRASQLPDGSAFKEPTTEALRTEFLDVVDAAIDVAFPQGAVLYFVTEEMEPYFKGDADYGACLDKLRNKLELYLDE
jgi:hypothetical protein